MPTVANTQDIGSETVPWRYVYAQSLSGDGAGITNLNMDNAEDGTLAVARGGTGQNSIANIRAGKDGDGNTISSTYLKLSGGTLTGRLTTDKAINAAITGTYTAAVTSSPYKPVKWTFNTGSAPTDGDIFTIKIPGAGHDYGVFISVDNGATYQPVMRFSGNRLTTHYPAGTYLTVIYSSSAVTYSVFAADGATARSNITGSWQIINDYDSGNDIYQLYSASGNGRPVETADNGGLGLHGYTLQMMTANQAWSSIACTSGSTAANSGTTTTKVAATCDFLLGSPILYMSSNSYVAPGGIGNVNGYTAVQVNLKYSTSGSYNLVVQKPVYLVGTVNSDGATFKLESSNWWTQTLPTSKDDKIYIMLGLAYDANNIYLYTYHPIFYYNGSGVALYGGGADSDGNPISSTYLKLSGGTMTGTINRYYGSASTSPMLTMRSNNQNVYLFDIGHSASATAAITNHYRLMYKGAQDQPNNSLSLYSNDTEVCTINENGVIQVQLHTNDDTSKQYLRIVGNNRFLSVGSAGLQAYTNTSTTSLLYLQYNGGNVQIGRSITVNGAATNPSISANDALTIQTTAASKALTLKSAYTIYTNRGNNTSFVFQKNSVENARFDATGHFVPGTDSTYDIGATALRWKDMYSDSINAAEHRYSDTTNAEKAYTKYNETDQSIDFVFI